MKEGGILSYDADRFSVPLSTIITLNHLNSNIPIIQGTSSSFNQNSPEGAHVPEPDHEKNKEALTSFSKTSVDLKERPLRSGGVLIISSLF